MPFKKKLTLKNIGKELETEVEERKKFNKIVKILKTIPVRR